MPVAAASRRPWPAQPRATVHFLRRRRAGGPGGAGAAGLGRGQQMMGLKRQRPELRCPGRCLLEFALELAMAIYAQ